MPSANASARSTCAICSVESVVISAPILCLGTKAGRLVEIEGRGAEPSSSSGARNTPSGNRGPSR